MKKYKIPTKIDCENIDQFLQLWNEIVNDKNDKLFAPEEPIHSKPLSVCLRRALFDELDKNRRDDPDFYKNQIEHLKVQFPEFKEQLLNADPEIWKKQADQFDKITKKIDVYPWSLFGLNLTLRYFPAASGLIGRKKLWKEFFDYAISKINLNKDISALFYDALKETIENTFSHGNSDLGCYLSVQIDDGNIVFCILDRGIGIFNSLKRKYPELINSEQAISESIKYGISGARDPDRGLGLWVINRNIKKSKGKMCILSGNGIYRYEYDRDNSIEIERCSTIKNSFDGTIINLKIINDPHFVYWDDDFIQELY